MEYVLKFVEDFRDGNVYPRLIRRGELIKADEMLRKRFFQSGPTSFEVMQKLVPQPQFKCSVCGKILKNQAGLQSHMNTHKTNEEN